MEKATAATPPSTLPQPDPDCLITPFQIPVREALAWCQNDPVAVGEVKLILCFCKVVWMKRYSPRERGIRQRGIIYGCPLTVFGFDAIWESDFT